MVLGLTDVKNLVGQQADGSALVGQQVLIGGKSFTVIGVFKSKGSNGFQDQDSIAIMPLTTARDQFVGNTGTVDGLTAQATSSKKAAAAQSEISAVLVAQHPGSSSHRLQRAQPAVAAADASRATTGRSPRCWPAIAAISLLVGGIGVMNIMLVTVTERTREIGIRKAVGARQGHILTQFLVEAVLLAAIGGLIGAAVAIVLSDFVTIENVTPVVEPYSVVLALGFAIGVGLFFGIYPANRAAKLRPIDALRYEIRVTVMTELVDIDDITPDEALLADVRKTRITTPATRVLIALVVVAAAFLGGALVERWQHKTPASSSVQSLIAQIRAAAGGAAGGSGGSGGASGASGRSLRWRCRRRRRGRNLRDGQARRRHQRLRRGRAGQRREGHDEPEHDGFGHQDRARSASWRPAPR